MVSISETRIFIFKLHILRVVSHFQKKLFLREPLLRVGKIEAVYPSVNLGKDPPAASVFLPWAFCVIQDEADSERVSPADLCRDTEAGSPHDRLQGTLCPPPLTQEATAS